MTPELACIVGLAIFVVGLAIRTARLERNLDWLRNEVMEGRPNGEQGGAA